MGEGGFIPGLTALMPGLVLVDDLVDANAVLQMTQVAASVAGRRLTSLRFLTRTQPPLSTRSVT